MKSVLDYFKSKPKTDKKKATEKLNQVKDAVAPGGALGGGTLGGAAKAISEGAQKRKKILDEL